MLHRYLAKSIGLEYGATPCFMAKPVHGLPGNSGHIHMSLTSMDATNLFARETTDTQASWADIANLSDIGRQFLAGLLQALPDIMPLIAPTINSYKRLVENYWAPVHVSWGLEDRLSSIRIIAPPSCKPAATRFEIRVPGADMHPHYALAAILAAGLRGIEKKLQINIPPTSLRKDKPERLPNSLDKAVERFAAKDSIARELFGTDFVEFFASSREHELKVWREAVTDWYALIDYVPYASSQPTLTFLAREFRRYIETV